MQKQIGDQVDVCYHNVRNISNIFGLFDDEDGSNTTITDPMESEQLNLLVESLINFQTKPSFTHTILPSNHCQQLAVFIQDHFIASADQDCYDLIANSYMSSYLNEQHQVDWEVMLAHQGTLGDLFAVLASLELYGDEWNDKSYLKLVTSAQKWLTNLVLPSDICNEMLQNIATIFVIMLGRCLHLLSNYEIGAPEYLLMNEQFYKNFHFSFFLINHLI